MSRTFKDMRVNKIARATKKEEPVRHNYRKSKSQGFVHQNHWDDDFCPECGGMTDFQKGFLTCTECNWSTFETTDLLFMYQLKTAN